MFLVQNLQIRLIALTPKDHLLPGANEVEDSVWATAEKTFLVRQLLKEGLLTAEKKEDSKKGLQGLSEKKAVNLVKNTYDEDLLGKWTEDEDRPSVLKAIEEQFKVLENAVKRDSKETLKNLFDS